MHFDRQMRGTRIGLWIALVTVFSGLAGCSAESEPMSPARIGAGAPPATGSQVNQAAAGRGGTAIGPSGLAGAGIPSDSWAGMQPGIMEIAGSAAPASDPSGLPSGTCANAVADTAPVTPVIWLIVDGSSSMNNNFANGQSRWVSLRSTLMDKVGIVDSLQSVAEFGMVIYSGGAEDPAQCVKLVTVLPALNNFAALDTAYPQTPLGMGTPTDKALDHVVTTLPVATKSVLDTQNKPIYVVLATDGQPNDNCGGGGGGGDAAVQQRVIDVVTKGTMGGMEMYVISMAGDDTSLQQHLDLVAKATASQTPPFVPATKDELVNNFRKIVGSASCQIDLHGKVMDGQECAGKVSLNGSDLTCANDNGWRLLDTDTLELTGSACTSFVSAASTVSATFPCEVFSPG